MNSPNYLRAKIKSLIDSGQKLVIIDLFCGAGGMSFGAAQAIEEIAADLDKDIEEIAELHAVNHWDRAIETHKANHPWANHYQCNIQSIVPSDIVSRDKTVHLLIACPDCTYFSCARGGGPKDPDSRSTPREVCDFVERLNVRNVLFENVPEFRNWGPLDEDNKPISEKKGDYFENWLNDLSISGLAVDHTTLVAANYGDPTTRRRLFVAGRKNSGVKWPEATHSDEDPNKSDWRTAADILDLEDPGESIWIRDLNDGRRKPLVNTTMRRIAEGLRRHCSDEIDQFADVISDIGREDVYTLRENIVDAKYATRVADLIDQPFLVRYNTCNPLGDEPTFLLRQQNGKGAHPINAHDSPLPTVATKGAISQINAETFILPKNGKQRGIHSNPTYEPSEQPLHTVIASDTRQGYTVSPYIVPFYNERSSQSPRVHSPDEPMPTVVSSKVFGGLCQPYLIEYYGNGTTQPLTEPLPTATTKDRFALVVPELYPLGLDIKFRMLKPRELAAAQGFPDDYTFTGNKTETVKQIGNAVPVNLAKSLCKQMLIGYKPTIDSFTDQSTSTELADD